jgi:hypothetical protein
MSVEVVRIDVLDRLDAVEIGEPLDLLELPRGDSTGRSGTETARAAAP